MGFTAIRIVFPTIQSVWSDEGSHSKQAIDFGDKPSVRAFVK